MKTPISITMLFFTVLSVFPQKKILVYHETNGFRHSGAITSGIAMFQQMGNDSGEWLTDNSQNSADFNTANLQQYDAVVFLNTSGDNLLSATERLAFENFIANGKGFIGIHAATDTYRDGSWPFYNELVGGIVQTDPNHTANNFNANMELVASHPIVDFLGPVGTIWNKNEEYYYWQINGGQLSTDNNVVLEVESTGSESYDAVRPITWYKESITYDDDNNDATPEVTLSGFRSFYTALGHNGSDYSGDTKFRNMLRNATLWAIGETLSLDVQQVSHFNTFPNPVENDMFISTKNAQSLVKVNVYNAAGQNILATNVDANQLSDNTYRLDLKSLNGGIYFIELFSSIGSETIKFVKK